jgi:hypothetical protein
MCNSAKARGNLYSIWLPARFIKFLQSKGVFCGYVCCVKDPDCLIQCTVVDMRIIYIAANDYLTGIPTALMSCPERTHKLITEALRIRSTLAKKFADIDGS